jgi:hypothetical protein
MSSVIVVLPFLLHQPPPLISLLSTGLTYTPAETLLSPEFLR